MFKAARVYIVGPAGYQASGVSQRMCLGFSQRSQRMACKRQIHLKSEEISEQDKTESEAGQESGGITRERRNE